MKNFFLTDKEIQDLIDEPKQMNCSAYSLLNDMKIKQGREAAHRQSMAKFPRNNGDGDWQIYLRHSTVNQFDFSCGLGFIPQRTNQTFTLRRYNGKSHPHTNRLENETEFYDFHIHHATERYQQSSYANEHYAQPTEFYTDIRGAFKILLLDCKVISDNSDDRQRSLFE